MNKQNYYTPLVIGIDKLFSEFENITKTNTTYPPHNIIKDGEDTYLVELALAGFVKDELDISVKDNIVTISAGLSAGDNPAINYIHKGIAKRAFKRTFSLGEYVEVDHAILENGILTIKMVCKIPEEKQKRTIRIR
jgi:molecular chaperone IbpA